MGFFDKIPGAASKAKDVMEDVREQEKLTRLMVIVPSFRRKSGAIGILGTLMWQLGSCSPIMIL